MKASATQTARAPVAHRPKSPARQAPSGVLTDLQNLADQSPTVQLLSALQNVAQTQTKGHVVQRLGDDEADAAGPNPDDSGGDVAAPVAEDLDEDAYDSDATESDVEEEDEELYLMASFSDGKIGSVYFSDGRIRLTHRSGPEDTDHDPETTWQYHIDRKGATSAFLANTGDTWIDVHKMIESGRKRTKPEKLQATKFIKARKNWIKHTLYASDEKSIPPWAVEISDRDNAFDDPNDPAADGKQLFEVWEKMNGSVGSHPSRGVAVKIKITQSLVDTLLEGVELANEKETPFEKNQVFYDHVAAEHPEFAKYMRKPDEIKY